MKPDATNKTFGIANKYLLIGLVVLLVIGIPAFGVVSRMTVDSSLVGTVLTVSYTGTDASVLNGYIQTPGISEIVISGNMTTNPIDIPSNIRKISGTATLNSVHVGSAIFNVGNSSLTIEGLSFSGLGRATFSSRDKAISVNGSNNSALRINNIYIRNTNITDFAGDGMIYLENVSKFEISGNSVTVGNYSGISMLSATDGIVLNNYVYDIGSTAANSYNAYGIYASRLDNTKEVSRNITISNNIIDYIPTWEGLDTHSGRDIVFSGNVVTRTPTSFGVGPTASIGSPKNITITGNTGGGCVAFTGVVVTTDPATGSITGNTFYRCDSTGSSGMLLIKSTKGMVVSGNTIRDAYQGYYGFDNIGLAMVGNAFYNITQTGMYQDSSFFSSGVFSGNIVENFPNVNATEGIRLAIGDAKTSPMRVCGNWLNATTPLKDDGARAVDCTAVLW